AAQHRRAPSETQFETSTPLAGGAMPWPTSPHPAHHNCPNLVRPRRHAWCAAVGLDWPGPCLCSQAARRSRNQRGGFSGDEPCAVFGGVGFCVCFVVWSYSLLSGGCPLSVSPLRSNGEREPSCARNACDGRARW